VDARDFAKVVDQVRLLAEAFLEEDFMTASISIRPYRMSDVDGVYDAVRESITELAPWMPWCHPRYVREETVAWVESRSAAWEAKTDFNFVIVSTEGTILGSCGLNRIEHDNGTANLGYWVRTSACRRGVATQAGSLLRDWAYANTALHRLEILAALKNVASLGVAEKLGAIREGVLRQRLVLRGEKHDAVMYSILRSNGAPETS